MRTDLKSRVLECLDNGLETHIEIAEELGHPIPATGAYMRYLRNQGLIREAGRFYTPGIRGKAPVRWKVAV